MVKINRDKNERKANKGKARNSRKKFNVSIITCQELEKRENSIIVKNDINVSLKRQDSAVLYFHTTNTLTRYSESELKDLKDNKQSQAPPACMYQPNIIKLNILKYNSDHSKAYEEECENFREKLNNLSLTHWDPKFLELLQKYNNGYYDTADKTQQQQQPGLGPHITNNFNGNRRNFFQQQHPVQQAPQQRRHVSWNNRVDERIIDKRQGNYQDRSVRPNYFDGMRAENQGNNWNSGRFRTNQNRNYTYYNNDGTNFNKINAFQQPRNDFNPISQNSSGNSLEKETSMESKKTDDSESNKKDGHMADDEDEPEWFVMPVSRLDTIELRGFDDDVCSTTTNGDDGSEKNGEPPIVGKGNPPARSTPTKRREFCFDEFSNPRAGYDPGYNQSRRMNYHQQSQYPQWFTPNPNHQRNYNRPPINSSNSSFSSSLNRSSGSSQGRNNFFDSWQRNQPLDARTNNENVNYLNQMQIQNQLMNVGDVENRLLENRKIYNLVTQIQNRQQQQQQQQHQQSDFDKFLEKISMQNQNQRKFGFPPYNGSQYVPHPQQMRAVPPMMPPQITQVNINGILETFRQMQNNELGAAATMRMPFQSRMDQKNPTISPEELMIHTQRIMQNAILRKQNEKNEKNDPQI